MTYEQFYFWLKGLIEAGVHKEITIEKIMAEMKGVEPSELYKNKIPFYGNCS